MYKYKKIRLKNQSLVDEHRLIMERYLERKLDRYEIVHHCNGNPRDNRINNLELMLLQEHSRIHAKEQPRVPCTDETKEKLRKAFLGEKGPGAKLTENQVREIRDRVEKGETYRSIAKDYPIHHQHITRIMRREQWGHIK